MNDKSQVAELADSTGATAVNAEAARERLLQAGLRLFASKGFANTSTRELAEAARVNVAAISYYFGDKAGLYRAAFFDAAGGPQLDLAALGNPAMPLAGFLRAYYEGFVSPLRSGEVSRWCMKLHVREMLEPTGVWAEEINRGIKPMHDATVAVLARHLGVEPDLEVHRLAICLAAPAVYLHVARDVTDALAPELETLPRAWELWVERLVVSALAMIDAERSRRAVAAPVGQLFDGCAMVTGSGR
jgi:AcrR family transcriptional regulator